MRAFKNITLIDGVSDKGINNGVILINEKGVIDSCGSAEKISIPDEAKIINLQGKTILPGLIDAHTHICFKPSPDPLDILTKESDARTAVRSLKNAQKALQAGITTIRDVGGKNNIEITIKKYCQDNELPTPNMVVSGRSLTMTGGHGWPIAREVDGKIGLRRGARQQIKKGADLIKLMATGGVLTEGMKPGAPQLTETEMKAAVKEAKKADIKAAAHAQGNKGIKNAINAGVDSIEHGVFLDTETTEMMVNKNIFLVPTLSAIYWIARKGEEENIPKYAVKKAEKIIEDHIKSFKMAYQKGVKIAMGTDAGSPFNRHGDNAFELILMVKHGMSAMQAIKSATSVGAELLGIASFTGSIESGKRADLLVLDENPLENIENIKSVNKVFLQGTEINTKTRQQAF
ncbi:metal-dependent hydrolase family protein [Halarsenatibacter silvermanii]|uniref:Imidazolonepropionase n=1 Tax=Halarsenatibacter silvermanii TaxID=321763 RepID=A0A1G9T160_9FIRM|nr:amidohydrolase family protein [Halarsenatibacter silvermanii]SDM41382.1 Imidazolonepropionase [Halarsenatibacter silvermanii]